MFFILLRTEIFAGFDKNIWSFLFIALFFTVVFALLFCFIWEQLKFRYFANIVVKSCINLTVTILENERIKINYKKTKFEGRFSKGVFWTKALADEYKEVENTQTPIPLECITYSVLSFFYLTVQVKFILIFFG